MNRAAFLDRDGVINRKADEGGYVTRWEDLQILPGVIEATALLNRAGFLVIVVSNQRCVAKRLIAAGELDVLHGRMCEVFSDFGAEINAVYYCPHEANPPCECRKPAPGMLLRAARTWDIDLLKSWIIGDSDTDVEAGKRAGCRTARLNGSTFMASTREDENRRAAPADITAASLLDAVNQILSREQEVSNPCDERATKQLKL
jgi:D-glycero-D-manno-heptose 1,7-bisphosphate phosphatase